MALLLGAAFFYSLFFFGWEVARAALKERRIERLIALSLLLGPALYVFFVNMLTLAWPGRTDVFYLVVLCFLAFALASAVLRSKRGGEALVWEVEKRWRMVACGAALALFVTIFGIAMRHTFDYAIMREPTAATMMEGNLPPVEIWNPTERLEYHYAPDLLVAATAKATGLPLSVVYALYKALFGSVLFLLVFLLVLAYTTPLVAFCASAGMLYLGTFSFVYISGALQAQGFKFVTDIISTDYTTPAINTLVQQHWGAIALVLMVAVVYLYAALVSERRSVWGVVPAGVLLALLALVAEPYFGVLCAALAVFPPAAWLLCRDTAALKRHALFSAGILLLALPLALVQGGVFYNALSQQLQGSRSDQAVIYTSAESHGRLFSLGTPLQLFDGASFAEPKVLLELGLPFIATLIAAILLLRRRHSGALLLLCVSAISLLVPFVLESESYTIDSLIGRFFYPAMLFSGIVVGALLAAWYLQARMRVRVLIAACALVLFAQGLFTHAVWSVAGYPPGAVWNPNAKFYAAAGSPEAQAYAWVAANTGPRDLFYIARENYSSPYGIGSAPNGRFVLNTGRMAPVYRHLAAGLGSEIDERAETSSPERAELFSKLSEACDPEILRTLGYRYAYVDGLWPASFEQRCLAQGDWQKVFEAGEEAEAIRIYEIR